MLYRLPVINSKHQSQAGFRFSIGPETFRARRQILKSKLVELLQALSSQTSQFCFLTCFFHCIIFKIIETLILSANTVYIKQLSGPEKLSGRLRNGPLGQNQLCNCNHFRHPIDKQLRHIDISNNNNFTVISPLWIHLSLLPWYKLDQYFSLFLRHSQQRHSLLLDKKYKNISGSLSIKWPFVGHSCSNLRILVDEMKGKPKYPGRITKGRTPTNSTNMLNPSYIGKRLSKREKWSVHAKEAHKQTRMSSRTTAMAAPNASQQILVSLKLMRSLKDY